MKSPVIYILFILSACADPFLGEKVETGFYKTGRGDNDLYYLLFKSRKAIKNPPLILWLNGGPGCSSMYGAFAENGPLRISLSSPAYVTSNPYSWNNEFDLIYVDSPSGVGFSKLYTKNSCTDTNCTIKDLYVFLLKFLLDHPIYQGRELYLSSESYGGHYIPVLAEYILMQGSPLFNLKGVAIGNGWFDGITQMYGYSLYAYEKQLISIWRFIAAYALYLFAEICYIFGFAETTRYISDLYGWEFITQGKFDIYDYTVKEYPLYSKYIQEFLSQPEIVQLMNSSGRPYFINNDGKVWNTSIKFKPEDDFESLTSRVQFMVDSKLKVLIFTGSYDFVCNVKMQELWLNKWQWKGHDTLVYSPYTDWVFESTKYGKYKKYNNFMHLVIFNASHMAPTEQPYSTLQMITHFIMDEIK
jgi:carboxypeptidase C (cathepsin A)